MSGVLGFAEMTCGAPNYRGGITKPGYGEPEPLKPVFPYDTQENIDKCLCCTMETCKPCSCECPINCKSSDVGRKKQNRRGGDERVLAMIQRGWVNIDAICEELGISRGAYFRAKRRLREERMV